MTSMNAEQFFNQKTILDLSFFNFENAITAAYFANIDLEIQRTNNNFKRFFPILGNVVNVSMLDVLEQLGLPGKQIDVFASELDQNGSVLLPEIKVSIDGSEKIYSLLSAKTQNSNFSYLNGGTRSICRQNFRMGTAARAGGLVRTKNP